MKIERINENQIRCILTPADLEDRKLKLSELAFGSEKAKSLFHDMMQMAATELGFEAENIPLMIEAIPSMDSIILIITKVNNPDDLEQRFPGSASISSAKKEFLETLEGAEDILDLLNKMKQAVEAQKTNQSEAAEETAASVRLFSFTTLDNVISACKFLAPLYKGVSTLYKDPVEQVYILALSLSDYTTGEFNRICNMFTEYASLEKADGVTLAFLEEHCTLMINQNAVEQLSGF